MTGDFSSIGKVGTSIGSWLDLLGPFLVHGFMETFVAGKTALILVGGKLSVTHQN